MKNHRNIEVVLHYQILLVLLILIPERNAENLLDLLRVEITEERPPGTFVLSVPAESGIQRKFSPEEQTQIQYKLVDSGDTRFFKLNKETGILSTSQRLDRERLCVDPQVEKCCNSLDPVRPERCILVVQVTAIKAGGALLQFIQIAAEIKDINDNVPKFSQSSQSLEVAENTKTGTQVHFFRVADPDSKANAIKRVSLVMETPKAGINMFRVQPARKGISLILVHNLDREKVAKYTFKILAVDGGNPPKTGSARVTARISDVNDNSPIWITKNFNTSIPENLPLNSPVFKLEASDADSGSNGRIYYEFNSQTQEYLEGLDKFKINAATGEIRLRGRLNYEHQRLYELPVIAQDFGKSRVNSATAIVTINITDVNDSPPKIKVIYLQDKKTITVFENQPLGQTVATIFADDPDTGPGGKVTCSLDSKEFRLDNLKQSLGGRQGYTLVTRQSFDRETTQHYRAILKCVDHGTPPMKSKEVLYVTIKDVNDNSPKFQKEIFEVNFPENNPSGQLICKINATDADKGKNGELKFWLADEARHWVTINEDTGLLYSATSFDRESSSIYRFNVFVKDLGKPQFTATSTVNINIQDTNDHEPRFTDIYFFKVTENSKPGTLVGTVRAEDQDLDNNGKIFYRLLTGSRDFRLNGKTGELVIRSNNIDREQKSTYELQIRAQDGGRPPRMSTTRVHINVVDVNDHAPRFIFPNREHNYVNVSCNELPNQVITRVQANDSDSDENAKIFYSIVSSTNMPIGTPTDSSESIKSNPSKMSGPMFDIDLQNGQLLLLRPFKHCGSPYEERIVLNATDQGQPSRSSTAVLYIRVLDQQPSGLPEVRSRTRYHLSAIVGLVVATIVLIFLLCIVLLLMRNRFTHFEKNYSPDHDAQEISKLNTKREVQGPSPRDLYTTPNYYYTCDAEVYDFMDAKTQEELDAKRNQGRLYMADHHPSCHTIAGDRPYHTLNRAIEGNPATVAGVSRVPPPYSNYSQGTAGDQQLANKYAFLCSQTEDDGGGMPGNRSGVDRDINSVFTPLVGQRPSGVKTLNRKASTGCAVNLESKTPSRIRTNSSGDVSRDCVDESLSMTHLSRTGTLPTNKIKNPYCTVSFV